MQVYQGTTRLYTRQVDATTCAAATCSLAPNSTLQFKQHKWRVQAEVGGEWRKYSKFQAFEVKEGLTGFASSFNANAKGWERVTGTWKIVQSAYYRGLGPAGEEASAVRAGEQYSTLDYRVRMKRLGSTGAANAVYVRGAVEPLDSNGWGNGYYFAYANDGSFLVLKAVDGNWSDLQPWTYHWAVNQGGWNTLRVVASGKTLKFYINGTLVYKGTDADLSTGLVGIAMYDGGSEQKLLVNWAKLTTTVGSSALADEDPVPGGETIDGGIDPKQSPVPRTVGEPVQVSGKRPALS
jgi:hypothetical protein